MLALGGSRSVESALLVENLKRRVLPAQRREGRSVSRRSSVITAPDRLSRLRLGNPSSIALPGLREGAFCPTDAQVMVRRSQSVHVPRDGLSRGGLGRQTRIGRGWVEVEVELFFAHTDGFFQGGAPARLAGSKVGFVGCERCPIVARTTRRSVHTAFLTLIFARFCWPASCILQPSKNPPTFANFHTP
jgi:hypothetical protein